MKNVVKYFAILLTGIVLLACHDPVTHKRDKPKPPSPVVDVPLEGKYLSVNFEANGGIPIPHEQDLIWGTKVVEPQAMSKDDCGFGGWYKEPEFINQWDFYNDTVTADITLYAKWIATNYYTVTFNPFGGTPIPDPQNIAEGGRAVRPQAVSRSGYGFGGWYTGIDFITEWDFAMNIVDKDMTLYANWNSNFKIVTFIANGGVPAPLVQAIIPGIKVVEPLPMRKPGSSFGGWYKEPELINQWDFYNDTINDDDIILYAKWDEIHCIVTFDAGGGTPIPENQDLVWGAKIVEPQVMNKIGCSFEGWYIDINFTDEWNFTNDKVTGDITLYAKWVTSVAQVPGGTFMMGTRNAETYKLADETPQHQITVSPFYMSVYQITQEQYAQVMGNNPSRFQGNTGNPVERVTWYDALEFCNKISEQEGLAPVYTIVGRIPATGHPITSASVMADFTKNGYRLPTEAEWEFACRGDYPNKATETATLPFGVGDGTKMAGGLANFLVEHSFDSVSGKLDYVDTSVISVDATTPVGSYPANNYGLYDMHGNVWEWCWDWYNQSFYQTIEASIADTKGPTASSFAAAERVMRGGSWNNRGTGQRSAYRNGSVPAARSDLIGFRVVRRL